MSSSRRKPYVNTKPSRPKRTKEELLRIRLSAYGVSEKQCSRCRKVLSIDRFPVSNSNSKYQKILTYCLSCKMKQVNSKINSSVDNYLHDKFVRLKSRAKRAGIRFNLTEEYIRDMLFAQKGKCFYTDIQMRLRVGEGTHSAAMSIDRIVPSKGYVRGNVVLCASKINIIKNNISLDEMRKWMPGWHRRFRKALS